MEVKNNLNKKHEACVKTRAFLIQLYSSFQSNQSLKSHSEENETATVFEEDGVENIKSTRC